MCAVPVQNMFVSSLVPGGAGGSPGRAGEQGRARAPSLPPPCRRGSGPGRKGGCFTSGGGAARPRLGPAQGSGGSGAVPPSRRATSGQCVGRAAPRPVSEPRPSPRSRRAALVKLRLSGKRGHLSVPLPDLCSQTLSSHKGSRAPY